MSIYKCNRCDSQRELLKETLAVSNDNVVVIESKCECGEWMEDQSKHEGFGLAIMKKGGKAARKPRS